MDFPDHHWSVPPYTLSHKRCVELAARPDITWNDIALLNGLISFDTPTGGFRKGIVWLKCQTLCEASSLSRRQVQDCRDNLVAAGLISVEATAIRSATPIVTVHWDIIVGSAPVAGPSTNRGSR